MNPTKVELRRSLKQARLELTDAERTLKSRAVVERLKQAIDWSSVQAVHYFEPMRELLEVDISDFITDLEDKYPAVQLCTPRLISGVWELIGVRGGPVPDNFDVIIVPMLGFDADLQRIGYGGGYYDKFLASQPQAKKVGVCFEQGRLDHIPAEPHDIPLNLILTEKTTLLQQV